MQNEMIIYIIILHCVCGFHFVQLCTCMSLFSQHLSVTRLITFAIWQKAVKVRKADREAGWARFIRI